MQTETNYDNQQRCYQLIAGNGAKLGSYRKHREAVEAQLALEAPQALEMAKRATARYPVLASRALRAAQLVAAGKVHLDTACHRVESQNGAGEYQVEQMDGTWRCSCPDWQASIAGEPFAAPVVGQGPKCKHILAVLMALKCAREHSVRRGRGAEEQGRISPAPLHPRSPAQSLWDRQQAIARFQEYVLKVEEEGADPRLLFVLAQAM